jgi:hypothetical protein
MPDNASWCCQDALSRREKDCKEERTLFCFPCEMANAINIPKTHLVMGLSPSPAVLLAFFVAESMEPGNLAVMVSVTPMQPGVMPCPARPLSL